MSYTALVAARVAVLGIDGLDLALLPEPLPS